MERIEVTLELQAELDSAEVRAELDRLVQDAELKIQATLDAAGLNRQLDTVTQDRDIDLGVNADESKLERVERRLDDIGDAADAATREIDQLDNELNGLTPPPPVAADSIANLQEQQRLEQQVAQTRRQGLTQATAAFAAFGAVSVQVAQQTIGAYADQQEALNVVALTFGDLSTEAEAFARSTEDAFSTTQALEAQAAFGGLLQNLGFAREESVGLSQDLTTLSQDLASAFNADPTVALEALRSGLAGQTEPLRQFNVFLSEAEIQQEALRLGLADTAGELDRNAKAQATLSLITQQTARVQGDFANTAEGLANSQRVLAANAEDAQARIGEQLAPAFERAQAAAVELLPFVEDLADSILPELAETAANTAEGLLAIAAAADSGSAAIPGFDGLGDAAAFGNNFLSPLSGAQNLIGSFRSDLELLGVTERSVADDTAALAEQQEQYRLALENSVPSAENLLDATSGYQRVLEDVVDPAIELAGAIARNAVEAERGAEAVELMTGALADGTVTQEELRDIVRETGLSYETLENAIPGATAQLEAQRAKVEELERAYENLFPDLTGVTSTFEDDVPASLEATQQAQQDILNEGFDFSEGIENLRTQGADDIAGAIIDIANSGDIEAANQLLAEALSLDGETLGFREQLQEEINAANELLIADLEALGVALAEVGTEASRSYVDGFTSEEGFSSTDITEFIQAQLDASAAEVDASAAAEALTTQFGEAFLLANVLEEGTSEAAEVLAGNEALPAGAQTLGEAGAESFDEGFQIQERVDTTINELAFNTGGVEVDARAAGRGVGLAITDGIEAGINAGRPGVLAEARALAEAVTATIRAALQIESPSKVTYGLGLNVVEGFALGLSDPRNLVGASSQQLASASVAPLARTTAGPGGFGFGGGSTVTTNNDLGVQIDNVTIAPTAATREAQFRDARYQVGRLFQGIR